MVDLLLDIFLEHLEWHVFDIFVGIEDHFSASDVLSLMVVIVDWRVKVFQLCYHFFGIDLSCGEFDDVVSSIGVTGGGFVYKSFDVVKVGTDEELCVGSDLLL